MQFHNTLTKQKETLQPLDEKRVTMYVCGPTVYNHPHIGNARPAVVFDTLFRLLKATYGEEHVVYARNITDIDDKINKAAAEQNVDIKVITDKFVKIYHDDVAALNCQPPTIEPRATDHVEHIIQMINQLVDKGHAYAAEGHVLFDVDSYEDYGKLSKRNLDDMVAGARVEIAPYKKNPMDFVLWKPSTDDLPGWESPWGRGRPGWHIECSSMIETHLGNTIDIHGGGHDLTFPHHENEIAQGTCAHDGEKYANIWMHNGFVQVNSEKMSKSIGNVLLVNDLLKDHHGETIRLSLLSAHYRQPLDWNDELLKTSKETLNKWYRSLELLNNIESITIKESSLQHALSDDLNTPKAIAEIHQLAKQANTAKDDSEKSHIKSELLYAGKLLGILQLTPEEWFKGTNTEGGLTDEAINALIEERTEAKAAKNFARADEIRNQLTAEGILLEDTAEGTSWRSN